MRKEDILHLAAEEMQQDWNDLRFQDVFYKAYIQGALMVNAEVEKLTAERDAALAREAELVAQVEVLRNLFPLKSPVSCEGFLNYPLRKYNEVVDAFNSAPQQHLRDIQAEAGRAGYEIGFGDGWEASQDGAMISPDTYAQESAEDYADCIRRGEK